MDPLQYHYWALRLVKRHFKPHSTLGPDDIYQIAMVGLLELWRKRPDASRTLCMHAMKMAVVGAIRKAVKLNAQIPLEDWRPSPGANTTEETGLANVEVQRLREAILQLPPKQREALLLSLDGEHLMRVARKRGINERLLLRNASHGRKRLRELMGASA